MHVAPYVVLNIDGKKCIVDVICLVVLSYTRNHGTGPVCRKVFIRDVGVVYGEDGAFGSDNSIRIRGSKGPARAQEQDGNRHRYRIVVLQEFPELHMYIIPPRETTFGYLSAE